MGGGKKGSRLLNRELLSVGHARWCQRNAPGLPELGTREGCESRARRIVERCRRGGAMGVAGREVACDSFVVKRIRLRLSAVRGRFGAPAQ
jgi:hypothetical protein